MISMMMRIMMMIMKMMKVKLSKIKYILMTKTTMFIKTKKSYNA